MRIGCCTEIENYEELCKIGYDYIDLAGISVMAMDEREFGRTAEIIARGPKPCNNFNAYCNEAVPMVGPGFDPEIIRRYAAEIARRGRILGIRSIGIGAPLARQIPPGFDEALADRQIREFLRITSEAAEKEGITILFEALNTYISNCVTSTREALSIVRELNLPNLRMVLDFHHMLRMGEDVEDISWAMPYVEHLHIDHTWPDGRRDYLQEEGAELYRRCICAARRCGYDGTLSIEGVTDRFPEDAARSFRILRKILDE